MAGISHGGKIPGHSGTDFKHRKAFSGPKAFYKNGRIFSKKKLAASSQSFEEILKARKHQKRVESRILIYLVLFIGILTISCLWYFDQNYPAYVYKQEQQRLEQYQNSKLEKQLKEDMEDYSVLVNIGNINLDHGKLNEAQGLFSSALRIFPNGIEGHIGMEKTLRLQCFTNSQNCKEAQNYAAFVKSLSTE